MAARSQLTRMFKRLPVHEPSRRIIETVGPHIPSDGLKALLAHECSALVVRNFYGEKERESLVNEIEAAARDRSGISNWKVSQSDGKLVDSEVETMGTPLNVAKGAGRIQEYFDTALTVTRRFRRDGRLQPIDKLRLELDEVHPYGAVMGRDETSRLPYAAGLLRLMKRSTTRGLIHMDDAAELNPSNGVFSANVYLQTSLAGGELEIWPVGFTSKQDLMDHALEVGLMTSASAEPQAQRALREHVLPCNPLVISPKPGDLVMLCVQRPHAVRGPIHGARTRINAQTFIVHEGATSPLKVEV